MFEAFLHIFGKSLPVTKFLQRLDLGFLKILHIFYSLMLSRPFDAMFGRIYSVIEAFIVLSLLPMFLNE